MIVLDCSAAVNMVNKTVEGDALQSLILPNEKTIASDLFFIEAASAVGKYIKTGAFSEKEALERLLDIVDSVDEFIPIKENYIEAFHESIRLQHSVYDMLYFTLARRYGATLLTLDAKLLKLCEEQGIDCVHKVSF